MKLYLRRGGRHADLNSMARIVRRVSARLHPAVAGLVALVLVSVHAMTALSDDEILPDVHPPIGVFGEVAHARGELMFSYRYQRQDYDGLMSGDSGLSVPPPGFAVIQTAMRTDTHLLEVMWSPLDEITFVLSLPYLDKEMDQVDLTSGIHYVTRAKGFGDLTMTVLYKVFEDRTSRVHLNLGLSLPSGSTNESQITPVSGGRLERLPYGMQLGSGTVDLRPGFTYNGAWRGNNWGGQISGVLHAGTNSRGYRLGNQYQVTGWAGRRWTSWLGTAFRLDWKHWFGPDGLDPLLQPGRSPAENAGLQGGRRLDALFGIDFFFDGGALDGARVSLEVGLPAYQDLEGPQLRTRWLLTTGLQYAF